MTGAASHVASWKKVCTAPPHLCHSRTARQRETPLPACDTRFLRTLRGDSTHHLGMKFWQVDSHLCSMLVVSLVMVKPHCGIHTGNRDPRMLSNPVTDPCKNGFLNHKTPSPNPLPTGFCRTHGPKPSGGFRLRPPPSKAKASRETVQDDGQNPLKQAGGFAVWPVQWSSSN